MSLTVTLRLWWVGLYLVVGAVLWLPLEYMAWRYTHDQRPFWTALRTVVRRQWYVPIVTILAWPFAAWEAMR